MGIKWSSTDLAILDTGPIHCYYCNIHYPYIYTTPIFLSTLTWFHTECGIWKSMHWFFKILRPFWGKINALKYIVLSYTAAALYNFSCLQKYQCIFMHNYHFWPCTLIYIWNQHIDFNINQCTWSKVVIMHNYTLIFL